jgi:hypothetical protein
VKLKFSVGADQVSSRIDRRTGSLASHSLRDQTPDNTWMTVDRVAPDATGFPELSEVTK